MDHPVTFAIGDVHGCFDKLKSLIAACELASEGNTARFILVGDYVDRGPETRKVIAFLIEARRREPERFICLKGNHEAMLLAAASPARSDRDLMNWLASGGEQTLDSYGVNDPANLPADHLAFMTTLPLTFFDGERLFVHAGIRPDVAIAAQSEQDLLWIREPFLSCDDEYGPLVVHGHTPTKSGLPDLRSNRLNLDTGACYGRPLTAARFTPGHLAPSLYCNSSGTCWQPR